MNKAVFQIVNHDHIHAFNRKYHLFKKGKGNQFHKKRECQKQSLVNNSIVWHSKKMR